MNDSPIPALKYWIKPLVWVTAVFLLSFNDSFFVTALLLFSPLILMPLWFGMTSWRLEFEYLTAVAMAGSFAREPGMFTALLALPWLVMRLLATRDVAMGWLKNGVPSFAAGCEDAAIVFPAIGAAWIVAHRANWTPWNFDPLIVLLTAAHFHHAGFTLPLMAGLNAKARPSCWTRFSCVAILAGVPLVATGITCSHFGLLPFFEPVGVTILVIGALGVAISQIQRGLERESERLVRLGFVVSGISLLVAMLLALGFGLRYLIPGWAMTMPQMWMIHGTLNAFGFGLCGISAWKSKAAQM